MHVLLECCALAGIDSQNPHHTLYEWAQKYGAIFRFKVLGEDIVLLNDADLISQANQGTCSS